MKFLKCLTVCEPWASAIIFGSKRHENRTWTTSHRGPLLVHAGMNRSWLGAMHDPRTRRLFEDCGRMLAREEHFGKIIGLVEITAVDRPEDVDSPFATGPYCWRVEKPRAFRTPIRMRGQQGLFDVTVDADLRAAIDNAVDPQVLIRAAEHAYWHSQERAKAVAESGGTD